MRTRASELGPGEIDVIVDRFVPVEIERTRPDRVGEIVADGVEAARAAGAGAVDVVFAPELRGTRAARLIEHRIRPIVSGIRSPATGSQIASRFVASTTAAAVEDAAGMVCVAGIGHASLGIAVGEPGTTPAWIGSRPFGMDRLASRARFQDPPSPVQLEVAKDACARALDTMQPPPFGILLAASDFEAILRDLCGPEAGPEALGGALDWVMGRTSDELSAVTGFDRHLARLLPAAIAVHLALAEVFEAPVTPVSPDPAAERALAVIGSGSGPREI